MYRPGMEVDYFPPPRTTHCLLNHRANVELPTASENVLCLDGTWRFALHSSPQKAIDSGFFRRSFLEEAANAGDGNTEGVRGADGTWKDTPVPSCWQLLVTKMIVFEVFFFSYHNANYIEINEGTMCFLVGSGEMRKTHDIAWFIMTSDLRRKNTFISTSSQNRVGFPGLRRKTGPIIREGFCFVFLGGGVVCVVIKSNITAQPGPDM